jgi:hypothetical protein
MNFRFGIMTSGLSMEFLSGVALRHYPQFGRPIKKKLFLQHTSEAPNCFLLAAHNHSHCVDGIAHCSILTRSQRAFVTMLSRSVAPRALRAAQRGYASASSASLNYTVSEASGLKVASRDLAGPVTTLAIVSKAGTRYQPAPGLTEGLNRYAFKVRKSLRCG